MQTADEIQSALKNLRYYSAQIKGLARKQIRMDCERGQEIGVNTNPGTTRFDSLAIIESDCGYIDCYAENIEVNLAEAVKQDKLLYVEEIEK